MSNSHNEKRFATPFSAKVYREYVRDMIRMRKKKRIKIKQGQKPQHQDIALHTEKEEKNSEALIAAYLHGIDMVNASDKDEETKKKAIHEIEEEIENIRKQISKRKKREQICDTAGSDTIEEG